MTLKMLLFVTAYLATGCAARTEGIASDTQNWTDRIVPSELTNVVANNAYEIVEQLRPQWLRQRGPTSFMAPQGERPAVFVDNIRYGDLEVLRDIPLIEIREIRFVSGPDATTRWGTGVVAGVIEVIRKTKKKKVAMAPAMTTPRATNSCYVFLVPRRTGNRSKCGPVLCQHSVHIPKTGDLGRSHENSVFIIESARRELVHFCLRRDDCRHKWDCSRVSLADVGVGVDLVLR